MSERTRESSNRSRIQVIERAADILRSLEGQPQGLSLSGIAGRVGIPRSTVHRIVVALAAEGFVTPVSPSRGVRLGPLILRLAVAGERDLPAEFRPLLLSLSSEVRETVNLSVLEHDNAVVIAQVVGPQVLTVTGEVGEPLPSHVTSSGLALLSVLSDAELRRLFPEVLKAWTEQTITDRELLLAEIAQIRTSGIAVAREYYTAGLCSVAVVVTKNVDRPVAISIPVPSFRFEEQEARLVDALLRRRAWVEGLCGPMSEAVAAESHEDDADNTDGPPKRGPHPPTA